MLKLNTEVANEARGQIERGEVSAMPRREPVPAGTYTVQLIEVAHKNDLTFAKGGVGDRVTLVLEIAGGEHEGRRIWDDILYNHSNSPPATKFGTRQLMKALVALGDDGSNNKIGRAHV